MFQETDRNHKTAQNSNDTGACHRSKKSPIRKRHSRKTKSRRAALITDDDTKFVIKTGVLTLFIVPTLVYLTALHLSQSLPHQKNGYFTKKEEERQRLASYKQAAGGDERPDMDQQNSPLVSSTTTVAAKILTIDKNSETPEPTKLQQEKEPSEARVSTATVPAAMAVEPAESVQAVEPVIEEGTISVKAFKATIFSDLTENASETAVAFGTEATVLDQQGQWLKIKMKENNTIGYIHITQTDR